MFHSDSNVWRLWEKTTEHNVVHPQPIIVFWMNACVALSLVFNAPSQNAKVRFKHLADSEPKKN